ncbi:MAG TPA: branched-chain amino acid ABC transporter permease [Clostridiales bacterium]|nr:branched-chain amino acid ABC transporter permease [Clostridiales bacterium]
MKKIMEYKTWIGLATLFALIYFLPLPIYLLHIIILTLLYAFMGTAWNLLCGYGGQLSLGYAAFTGMGAYTTLLFYQFFNVSPWLGMLFGGILSALLMTVIAYPCFRFGVRGPYFTLASIAVAEILRDVLTTLRELTGGSLGLSLPYQPTNFGAFQFDGKKEYYLIILFFWLIAILIVKNVRRLKYYLIAIREDEDAAAALGISVNKTLLRAALISAFLTSMGGSFYVQYFRYIDPDSIAGLGLSVSIALISVVGGTSTLFGPTVGALILVPVSEYLRLSFGAKFAGLHLLIYGILLIATIRFLPDGIISLFSRDRFHRKRVKQKSHVEGGRTNE